MARNLTVNGVEFSDEELLTIAEKVQTGDITSSLLVLAVMRQERNDGAETFDSIPFSDLLDGAVDNLLSWYSDEYGDPIEDASIKAKASVIETQNQ